MRGPRPRSRVGPQSERGEEGGKGKGEGEDEEDEEERRVVVKISADDEEEQREGAFRRLESLGYRVGQGLAERWVIFFFLVYVTGLFVGALGMKGWER